MNIAQFKQTLSTPLRQTTLSLIVKNRQVLLAMKKRGFGEGLWNCPGGKPNEGESLVQTAIRETAEEIGCTPTNLTKVAVLDFYFPLIPLERNFNQQTVVYIVGAWSGEPIESEEMKPQWFDIDQIPYKHMWPADAHWMPLVFEGKLVKAEFLYGEGNALAEVNVQNVMSF